MTEPQRRLVGLTHDGYELSEDYTLTRCGPKIYKWSGIVTSSDFFSVEKEFNTDWEGEKKPYWSIYLFGFHVQLGWLWGRETNE